MQRPAVRILKDISLYPIRDWCFEGYNIVVLSPKQIKTNWNPRSLRVDQINGVETHIRKWKTSAPLDRYSKTRERKIRSWNSDTTIDVEWCPIR